MNYYIWGIGVNSKKMVEFIDKNEGYECVGFIDNNSNMWNNRIGDRKVYSPYELKEVIGEEDGILILGTFSLKSIFEIIEQIKNCIGICKEKIFLCAAYLIENMWQLNDNVNKVFVPYYKSREIHSISYILRNDCNLRCKGCVTASPLVKNKDVVDFNEFKRDIDRMKELFDNITRFSIQGGEVLLDEDLLCKCVKYYREKFQYGKIFIRTNGALIPNLKETTLKCLYENNVIVEISLYKMFLGKIDRWINKLKEYELETNVIYVEKFWRNLCKEKVHGSKEKSYDCFVNLVDGCLQLQRGLITRCPQLRAASIINDVFKTNLPIEGGIDIYKMSGDRWFYDYMRTEYELCSHCRIAEHVYDFEYEHLDNNMKVEDWLL